MKMFILILISVLILISYLLKLFYKRIIFWQKVNRIPILPGLPIIGIANEAIGSLENFFKLCMEWSKIDAPILGAWFGPKYYIRLTNPVDIQTVLNSPQCINKGSEAVKLNARWTGLGLEMSPGHIWKGHRRIIAHCFNTQTLQSFLTTFERQTKKTIEELSSLPDTKKINILPYTCSYSLRSVCETTLGIKSALDNNECIEFIDASQTIVKILMKRITNILYYFDTTYFLTSLYRFEKTTLKTINSFIQKIISEKTLDIKNTQSKQFSLNENSKKSNIFLEQLIRNTNFSNKLIEDHLNVMIFAGHETSGSALAFTILMLAMHKDIQNKVALEISEHTSNEYNYLNLQMGDLKKFIYLEMVIFETLRFFPVAPLLTRYTTGDVKLGTTIIPAGIDICILIYSLHHDVKLWGSNSHLFNPDNFLPEEISKRHPLSYLPFSSGPRNCIGYRYAMLSMKIFLIYMIKNFEFSTDMLFEDIEVKQEIVLKIVGEHSVYLRRRENTITPND